VFSESKYDRMYYEHSKAEKKIAACIDKVIR